MDFLFVHLLVHLLVRLEPDMNAYILRYGLMIVSFLLVAITVAVIKFFLKPKWKKFVIHIKVTTLILSVHNK